MVETRHGGDREKTTMVDTSKSTDLQQIQDDLEMAKLNYESLARNERSAKERVESMSLKVDSVEKKIDAMGAESNTRFETLEQKMTFITELLTRFEDTAMFAQRPGKEIASSSQPCNEQVPMNFPEPERSPNQLGYRGIHGTLANRDKMLRKIEMPVFSGNLPFDWISRAERFFQGW